MKQLLILCLIGFVGCKGQTQKVFVKKSEQKLYCNDSTTKNWIAEARSFGGLSSFVMYNGRWYQDTTRTPPEERLKQVMLYSDMPLDTVIASTSCEDYMATILKITECDECPLKEVPGYVKSCNTIYYKHAIFEDTLTKKRYINGSGFGFTNDTGNRHYKYFDRNKMPFPKTTTIWKPQ